MSIYQTLLSTPQREVSGSTSSSRFDYQKHWAILKLLELHKSGNDYVLIVEYHDDILVLNSEDSPSAACFIQVKTKSKNAWTVHQLTKTEIKNGTEKLSIIGKLYNHKLTFSKISPSLHLVTNADFSFDSRQEFKADTVLHEDKDKISNAILNQLPKLKVATLSDLTFHKSPLGIDDPKTYVIGSINDFILNAFDSAELINLEALYRIIYDDIKKKNDYAAHNISTEKQLLTEKSITRSQFTKTIEDISKSKQIHPTWDAIRTSLELEGMPGTDILSIFSAWNRYAVDRLDPEDEQAQQISSQAAEAVKQTFNPGKLTETLDSASIYYQANYGNPSTPFYGPYLKASILWAICEKLFQETYPEPPEAES